MQKYSQAPISAQLLGTVSSFHLLFDLRRIARFIFRLLQNQNASEPF